MPIKTDAADMQLEIAAAESARAEILADFDKRLERFHGAGFRSTTNNNEQAVNFAYEFTSLMLPKTVFRAPRWRVMSRMAGRAEQTAADTHFLNRWSKDAALGLLLPRLASMYFFAFSAVVVGMERRRDLPSVDGGPVQWPTVAPISPKRLLLDPMADHWTEARFIGHTWVADRDSLVESAKAAAEEGDDSWDIEAIRSTPEDAGINEYRGWSRGDAPRRGEIVGYDIWIRDLQPDPDLGPADGFNGALVSYAKGSEGSGLVMIRRPRPYFGPEGGPIVVLGAYDIEGSPFPAGPLAFAEPSAKRTDAVARVANRSAETYKRVVLVQRGSDAEDAALAPHDFVIPVDSLPDDRPIEIEVGGVTDQQLRLLSLMQQQLERLTGMDLTQTGDVPRDGTATGQAIANAVTETRGGWVRDRFQGGLVEIGRRVLWYAYHTDRVQTPLGQDFADEYGMAEPWYIGGESDGMAPFAMLDLEIEALSMERTDEPAHQNRVLMMTKVITDVAAAAAQFPAIDWGAVIGKIGDAFNFPELRDIWDQQAAMMSAGPGGTKGGGQSPGLPPQLLRGSEPARGRPAMLAGNATGSAAAAAAGVG